MKLPTYPDLLAHSFNDHTYPKTQQADFLIAHDFDLCFHKKKLSRETMTLRHFMDILVAIFIEQHVPVGGRILEVGGGNSRVLAYFQKEYECWNVDKLEGLGYGPLSLNRSYLNEVKLVEDYMGNFNQELPKHYFDFVFSLAALEVLPEDDHLLFENIIADIERVLKPGRFSLHCMNIVLRKQMSTKSWANPIIEVMFQKTATLNDYLSLEQLEQRDDVFCLSQAEYEKRKRKFTQKAYQDFGLMTSCHVLWQSGSAGNKEIRLDLS